MSDPDRFLYKYRTIDEDNINRARRIFTDNELYFSSKNQFNDPFDCKFGYSFTATKPEIKKYFKAMLDRSRPDLNRRQKKRWIVEQMKTFNLNDPDLERMMIEGTDEIISGIGICSLTEVPDDILMWSHYADSHKGFCIKLLDDEKERFIQGTYQVSYSDEFPIVNPIRDDVDVRMNKTLLTKAKHWDYEKEWRTIDHEKGTGIKKFPPHLLVGVIFGCKMTENHKEKIREWCADRGHSVTFYQAQEASHTYSLEITKV